MIVTINNKNFTGRYNKKGKFIIPLNNISDIIWFKEWEDRARYGDKRDYLQEVPFVKITERGTLKNCFPILDKNEEYIELVYDFYVLDEVKIIPNFKQE